MLPIVINGHIGIGDNLFQRAIIREILRRREHSAVWLKTCHYWLYHDLIDEGLEVRLKHTHFRVQHDTIKREWKYYKRTPPPRNAVFRSISYSNFARQKGSIMAAMFSTAVIPMPEKPDFSLPIREDWAEFAQNLISSWNTDGKPVMLYRPLIVRKEWMPTARRNPLPDQYDAIFNSIRERFFVVSISNLKTNQEWIVGPKAKVDLEMHDGRLAFEHLAALFQNVDLVFAASGFAPILAEAVGTKNITVYGGRESSRTVQSVGFYTPHLSIDPDEPCDCHVDNHECKKHISIEPAIERAKDFVKRHFDLRYDLHRQSPQGETVRALAQISAFT